MATEACSSWSEKMIAELYGELAPEQEREELRGHLRRCAACSAAWEDLTAAREALRTVELPVPATPRLALFPLGRRRAVLPFAAGFAAAAVLALGIGVGWALRGSTSPAAPLASTGLTDADREAVAALVRERVAEERKSLEQVLARQTQPAPGVTRDELAQLLAASERRIDQRRATDMRYVLGEIGAAEMRAGASIGETQKALQYVALANNPSASLH
jgi:predicted anti-sigma-YlaC factor YlaD